jgi:hypothetical protein
MPIRIEYDNQYVGRKVIVKNAILEKDRQFLNQIFTIKDSKFHNEDDDEDEISEVQIIHVQETNYTFEGRCFDFAENINETLADYAKKRLGDAL